ncbi:unnamed protein product [Moneuplotes crassus]|uniref:Uncharacterized protein n=3 Tax=Euplotes crassus TaxID=5936 RepID=A0AAD1UKN3_EUPCR|nr:unnamed protein product [Moneuplotes crassus]
MEENFERESASSRKGGLMQEVTTKKPEVAPPSTELHISLKEEIKKEPEIDQKSERKLEQKEEEKHEQRLMTSGSKEGSSTASPKKLIKIPKHAGSTKKVASPMDATIGKNSPMKNIYKSSGKSVKSKYRTMKSLDKARRYKGGLASSFSKMSSSSSQGFRTHYNTRQGNRSKIPNGYRSLMTLQRAGPGSYNLPPLLGGFIHQNNKRNNPRYSIGKASKYEVQSMTKEQLQRSPGAASPGVGSYSPDHNKFRADSPRATIGRERRFIQLKSTKTLKREVPHAYIKQDKSGLGSTQGRGFTKEKRFVVVAMKNRDKLSNPAPSHYNHHLHNTISSNFGNLRNKDRSATKKYHNKPDFKKQKGCYGNESSPGPGAYDNHLQTSSLSRMRRSHHNSFTKSERNLLPSKKSMTNEPSPASYKPQSFIGKCKGGVIGTRKSIDFTQLHSQFKGLIKRGLV